MNNPYPVVPMPPASGNLEFATFLWKSGFCLESFSDRGEIFDPNDSSGMKRFAYSPVRYKETLIRYEHHEGSAVAPPEPFFKDWTECTIAGVRFFLCNVVRTTQYLGYGRTSSTDTYYIQPS